MSYSRGVISCERFLLLVCLVGSLVAGCGGAVQVPTTPVVVDSRAPDRRAIDETLRVLEEGEGPTAYDLARGFLEQFPESRYVVTAHGVLASVDLDSDSPETAREPLATVIRLAEDPLVRATAHLRLADLLVGTAPSDALDHLLAAHAAIARLPDIAPSWDEDFVAQLPAAILASGRADLAQGAGVLALLDANGFGEPARSAIAHRTAELAFAGARWSLTIDLQRALGMPHDADAASCDVLARAARASGYGGGALEPAELDSARACGIVVGVPVRIESRELAVWVDALHPTVEACVHAERARLRTHPVELMLQPGTPKPRFVPTGVARLDRCLGHAVDTSSVLEPSIQRPDAFAVRSAAPLLSLPLGDDP